MTAKTGDMLAMVFVGKALAVCVLWNVANQHKQINKENRIEVEKTNFNSLHIIMN